MIYIGDQNTRRVQYSQGWFSHVVEMLMVMVQDLSLLRKLSVACYYKIRVEVVLSYRQKRTIQKSDTNGSPVIKWLKVMVCPLEEHFIVLFIHYEWFEF